MKGCTEIFFPDKGVVTYSMPGVRKIFYKEKEIIIVDYSDSNGDRMVEIFNEAGRIALLENKPVCVLNIFNDKTYITPGFMRHVEKEIEKVDKLIVKQAIIGLSGVQVWILKGMNLWYKRQIHNFNSMEEALAFLVAENN
jgi:hypothetical protein